METIEDLLVTEKTITELPNQYQTKARKLIAYLFSVLHNPFYKKQLYSLMAKFNLTETDVINSYLDYNLDIYQSDNSIYDSVVNRMVLHIHNLILDSWHQDRQEVITNYIQNIQPQTVVDIGFGVPSRYLKEIILNQKNIKATLCDLFDSAFNFASALLEQWDTKWQDIISFKKVDMNNAWEIGNFDVYLFQDSIEHVKEPTKCLTEYIKYSPANAKFILSLPIGPLFPRHYIAWLNDQDAYDWLKKCGLTIIETQSVWVNLKVDLFAEQLGEDYHNLIVLCSKSNMN